MKTVSFIIKSVLLSIFIIGFIACSDDDNDDNNNNSGLDESTLLPITNSEVSGSWIVTLFRDDDEDETSDFNGLTINFEENGAINITDGSNTVTGTWSINSNNKRIAIDLDESTFVLLSNREELEDLEDDRWAIVEKTDTQLHLLEDDDLPRDRVHFERVTP
ncbi:hypothetical protein J8281_07065 [Aquimarina sp. U1-2]|uniref:lipocalin-like domain-containing protein n=1 Tax=Aquimarina sp. U1-2 TaxID=2823141 RepID=UPI001AECDE66|nr:glycoside hydrolase family 43 C-terminal domain-containing protein [Aquimarina sp. U1-2]MBP2831946.1 hypothetical protein [Aquimarina sp. U1-2]